MPLTDFVRATRQKRQMPKMWKRLLWIGGACFGILLYFCWDPAHVAVFPRCPFYMLTGLQCPGCGIQRALHSLLHLDFRAAWHYNAFFAVVLSLWSFIGMAGLLKDRFPLIFSLLHSRFFTFFCLFLCFAWWVGRNLFPSLF